MTMQRARAEVIAISNTKIKGHVWLYLPDVWANIILTLPRENFPPDLNKGALLDVLVDRDTIVKDQVHITAEVELTNVRHNPPEAG